MASCSSAAATASLLCNNPTPSTRSATSRGFTLPKHNSSFKAVGLGQTLRISTRNRRICPLNAAKTGGIEPDLPEDDFDDIRTAGEDDEINFPYGYADGHHTFHKKDANVDVWEAIKEVFVSAGGPTGGQAFIAWATLPAVYAMMAYGVEVEYIFLAIVLFVFAFIGIEMDKPELDHEFPPEVYKERRKNRLSQNPVE